MIAGFGLEREFVTRTRQRVNALSGVDFSASAGDLVVVCGPSGCGKSTLLNLVGLLDRPTRGRLSIAGVDVGGLDVDGIAALRRDAIGFLFQDAGLIEPMNVIDNLILPLAYRQVDRADRVNRARAALDSVGLEARLNSSVSELSGGERQRIGLARAIISGPKILICDEPTAGLDRDNSVAVAELLQNEARHGVTVICASHDHILMDRADRLVSLAHGRLAEEA